MPCKGEGPAQQSNKSTTYEFKNTWMSPLALALALTLALA